MKKLQNQDSKYKVNANKIDKSPNNKRKKIILIIIMWNWLQKKILKNIPIVDGIL